MEKKQAFEIIVQALEGANAGQRFALKDSATIFAALNVLGAEFINEEPNIEEEPKNVKKSK